MTGPPEPGLLEIGHVVKPHGLHGEVVVHLVSNRPERLAAGSTLRTAGGVLEVTRSRPHQKRFIVAFAGTNGRDAAEVLRGTVLWAEPLDEAGTIWAHEVIGLPVVDQHGTRHGRVTALEANPASDLLVLDDGGLVPVRFVTGVRAGEHVEVDVPPGLLDG